MMKGCEVRKKDIELEKALFIWFKQKQEDGIPISGLILKAMVFELHKQFQAVLFPETVKTEFNASQSWFSRFCKCRNIR